MNITRFRFLQTALLLAVGSLLLAGPGCQHAPPRNTTPLSETQAPLVADRPRPSEALSEKRLQGQIDLMQEQIGLLSARTDALAQFHGTRMGPKWVEKVQAARADASRSQSPGNRDGRARPTFEVFRFGAKPKGQAKDWRGQGPTSFMSSSLPRSKRSRYFFR